MSTLEIDQQQTETWGPTMGLRWREVKHPTFSEDGGMTAYRIERVLEQAYREHHTGKIEWRGVPIEKG